jgi:Rieske Fe-S protein
VEIYDPSRKPVKEALQFVKEQTLIAAEYAEWASSGDVDDPAAIPPGEGAIVRRGLTKYAVHRDEDGALHAVSAKCTHLGCIVHWNTTEKTWDCPCHGSRFTTAGVAMHGPAVQPLAVLGEDEERELLQSRAAPADSPPRNDARR